VCDDARRGETLAFRARDTPTASGACRDSATKPRKQAGGERDVSSRLGFGTAQVKDGLDARLDGVRSRPIRERSSSARALVFAWASTSTAGDGSPRGQRRGTNRESCSRLADSEAGTERPGQCADQRSGLRRGHAGNPDRESWRAIQRLTESDIGNGVPASALPIDGSPLRLTARESGVSVARIG
jgi:hypothetical protein